LPFSLFGLDGNEFGSERKLTNEHNKHMYMHTNVANGLAKGNIAATPQNACGI